MISPGLVRMISVARTRNVGGVLGLSSDTDAWHGKRRGLLGLSPVVVHGWLRPWVISCLCEDASETVGIQIISSRMACQIS